MATRKTNIFGQGLGFPPRVGGDGRLYWSVGEQNVRESLRIILLTEPGERLMRETFGCGLRRFLFEPNTVTTRQLIKERIIEAVGRWEPRVALQEVTVEGTPDDPRLVAITIQYRLIATQSVERLSLSLQLEG
ncbi:MAG: GPW/gp25 family protein [Anaerolineae bacterium]|nr:GPW/gp25 family protein [Anaerolineae bacterium]MCB0234251.1 GPW/gp25 family protein [Anaerolineae bacterium]MCB0241988.1 GPW/gp25 family protein [Anaerolineae bacterium]MCB0247915.1 GPW/gp25 family protein [Anaerolineae bacterium]MCO5242442.1 GPW/gp25 family protein [Anaerolineae bacterium]